MINPRSNIAQGEQQRSSNDSGRYPHRFACVSSDVDIISVDIIRIIVADVYRL